MRIVGASLAVACAVLAIAASPAFAWSVSSFSASDEQLLFTLTNQDRASAGLNALVNDSYLHQKAEWRAQDMGDRDYFSHEIPPDNRMVFSYMQSDGYCFKVAGENIGLSTWGDDVATNRIEAAFMRSTSHRDNILGAWARMGIGAYQAADGRKLYAVLFSVPCGVTVPTPAPVATPVRTPVATPVAPPPPVSVATPTRRPTPKPTIRPISTPPTPSLTESPSAIPSETPGASDTPAPTASAAPSATSTPSPAATTPGPPPSVTPSGSPPASDAISSLRVREKRVTQGPIDSLFQSLFGGLFGW